MSTSAGPRLLGPADVRAARGRARPAPDQAARPELRHRRQHRAPHRARVRGRRRRRRRRGRPGARLADPGPARGRRPGGRHRDRRRARRAAARRRSRSTRPARPTASRWSSPTRCGSTEVPGPPPTALVANLPYNVSVPVLLHLLALLPSLERGLVMVQAEVADRLAAPPGSQGLRRPVGQGRLVRRRAPGRRGRPQRLLAGAQRRLRPGRLDPPRAAGHHRHPRAGLRGRRRRLRPAPQDAARRAARAGRLGRGRRGRPRAPPASTRSRAARSLDVERLRADRRGAAASESAAWSVTVRAPAKINLHLGVGAPARGRLPPAGHRLPGRRPVRRRHRPRRADGWALGVTVPDWMRRGRRAR